MFLVFHTGEDVLTAIHTFAVVPGQVLREEQRAQLGKPQCGRHGGGVAVPGTELLTSTTTMSWDTGSQLGDCWLHIVPLLWSLYLPWCEASRSFSWENRCCC